MHSTDNLEDGYIGSGKRLWYSIHKYGKDNHHCEILEFLESRNNLKSREKELINEQILLDPLCMNLKLGGEGGNDHILSNPEQKEWAKAGRAETDKILEAKFGENWRTVLAKLANRIAKDKKIGIYADDYVHAWNKNPELQQMGNTPAARAKAKITQKATFAKNNHQQGNKNSQFGTMWITNQVENKKIQVNDSMPDGWVKGRSIRK